MARPKGSKNKAKTTNGGEGTPGIGHNGNGDKLTDDESRALTLHHMRAYQRADALVERAKDDRKAVADTAKADLGKGALADIKDMIAAGDEKKLKAKLERELRLARWLGLPVGVQVDMFADRMPAEERWALDGKTAGMAGDVCTPPASLSPSAAQIWIRAWHEGQAILASAFAKKKPDAPAIDVDGPHTADAPFHAPEDRAGDP